VNTFRQNRSRFRRKLLTLSDETIHAFAANRSRFSPLTIIGLTFHFETYGGRTITVWGM
jgi:hypothetical protein